MSNVEIVGTPIRLRCKLCPVQRCLDNGQALTRDDFQQFEMEHRHLPPPAPKPRRAPGNVTITLEPWSQPLQSQLGPYEFAEEDHTTSRRTRR